jgi:hypothetical protein
MLLFVKFAPYHVTGSTEGKFTALPILNPGAGRGGQCNIPAALPMGRSPGAHCRKGWMGPRYAKESLNTDCATSAPFVLQISVQSQYYL